jgi:polyhydroxyalkanoate synthesis regulator phasin
VSGNVIDRLKARGEELLGQVSSELMQNEGFLRAMQAAMKGKEKVDRAVAHALKTMNVPTRTEFKKAVRRLEALEAELAALKASGAGAPRAPRGRGAARKKTE